MVVILLKDLQLPVTHNAVTDVSIKLAWCYFLDGRVAEFAELLNIVEQTLDAAIKVLEENHTKELKNVELRRVRYDSATSFMQYYLDAKGLKYKILQLWTTTNHMRQVQAKNRVETVEATLKMACEIFEQTDVRVIIAVANLALTLYETGNTKAAFENAEKVESLISLFAAKIKNDPLPVLQNQIKEKNIDEIFEMFFLEENVMIHQILIKILEEKSKKDRSLRGKVALLKAKYPVKEPVESTKF